MSGGSNREGSERAKIERLVAQFAGVRAEGIVVGIGDDAAVLQPPPARSLVWTVDAQVEGVHFRREWLSVVDIGWRSFVAAASDIAAMGADPWCALSSLVLPAGFVDDALDALAQGQAEAARAVGCPIVGGNLSRGRELSVTTTLLGSAESPLQRSGAQVGDGLWVAGDLGLASLGLTALERAINGVDVDEVVAVFRRPRVRIASGRELHSIAHAAIDVSDGLVTDARRVADASGVAIVIDEVALLAHAGEVSQRAAACVGRSVLDAALYGGEDYALLAASARAPAGFARIGEVRAGEGVWLTTRDGATRRLEDAGFDHFAE